MIANQLSSTVRESYLTNEYSSLLQSPHVMQTQHRTKLSPTALSWQPEWFLDYQRTERREMSKTASQAIKNSGWIFLKYLSSTSVQSHLIFKSIIFSSCYYIFDNCSTHSLPYDNRFFYLYRSGLIASVPILKIISLGSCSRLTGGLQLVSMCLAKGDSCPPLEIQPGVKKHCCTPCKGYCMSGVCAVHPFKILFNLALTGIIRKRKNGFACRNISMFQIGTRLKSLPLSCTCSPNHIGKKELLPFRKHLSFMHSPLVYNGRLFNEPAELLIWLSRHQRTISNQLFGQTWS